MPISRPAQPCHARRAFTLVELLVVIGIIALLISILLPALNRARAQANTVKCLANLRSIGQSIVIYTVQNKGTLPYGYWDGVGGKVDGVKAGGNPGTSSDWSTLLLTTTMNKGSQGSTYADLDRIYGTSPSRAFECPTAVIMPNSTSRSLHYGSHPRLMPELDQKEPSIANGPTLKPYKISKIRQSSDIALVFDAVQYVGPTQSGNASPVAFGVDQDGLFRSDRENGHTFNFLIRDENTINMDQAVFASNADWGTQPVLGAYTLANIRWRHGKNDTANFIFADGHADTRRLKFGKDAEFKLRNLYVNKNE